MLPQKQGQNVTPDVTPHQAFPALSSVLANHQVVLAAANELMAYFLCFQK